MEDDSIHLEDDLKVTVSCKYMFIYVLLRFMDPQGAHMVSSHHQVGCFQ